MHSVTFAQIWIRLLKRDPDVGPDRESLPSADGHRHGLSLDKLAMFRHQPLGPP